MRAYGEKMCSQARGFMWLHRQIRRNGLAISRTLRIRPSTMYLKIGIRRLAIQDLTGCLRHGRIKSLCILLLLLLCNLGHMRLRIWRGQVRLAFLKMLDLTRRVLCADEAAVQTAHFVTFGWCILVLEFGLARFSACRIRTRSEHNSRRLFLCLGWRDAPW